jgi:hypothetical protein
MRLSSGNPPDRRKAVAMIVVRGGILAVLAIVLNTGITACSDDQALGEGCPERAITENVPDLFAHDDLGAPQAAVRFRDETADEEVERVFHVLGGWQPDSIEYQIAADYDGEVLYIYASSCLTERDQAKVRRLLSKADSGAFAQTIGL